MFGDCLAHDGTEKFYGATPWMSYLIGHFLSPNASARSSGLADFTNFTFDHVLNGIIAACRRDTRELYLIHVEANEVFEDLLRQPDTIDPRLLPYEAAIDSNRVRRRRRR